MTVTVPERLPRGIRRLPNGRYRVRKGARDLRAKTYAEAIAIYEELHTPATRHRDTTATLVEYLVQWLHSRQDLARSSVLKYENITEFYVRGYPIAKRRVESLTAEDFDGYFRALAGHVGHKTGRPLEANTIRGIRRMLNAAMKAAAERGFIKSNPVPLATLPRGETVRRVPPTAKQVERILAALKGHRLFTLFYLAARTGVRKAEAMSLTWTAVDLESEPPRIRIAGTKTPSSRRTLAIDADIAAELERHRQRQAAEARRRGGRWANDYDLVFTSKSGRRLSPDYVLSVAKRAIESSGVADERRAQGLHPLTLHDLRHAFATHAAAGGVPSDQLSKFLGHSTHTITVDLYYHPTVEDLADVVVRHGAYLNGATTSQNGNPGPDESGPVALPKPRSKHENR